MSVSHVLYSLTPSAGDIIKEQGPFAQYVSDHQWFGSLDTIRTDKMYLLRISHADSMTRAGYPVDIGASKIMVDSGWNYISYLPQTSMLLSTAVASLHPVTDDVIKSQFAFAMYDSSVGWAGNLFTMNPKFGYLLKFSHQDSLVYSSASKRAPVPDMPEPYVRIIQNKPEWMLAINAYQYTMSVVAEIDKTLLPTVNENTIVGIFAGNECRGYTKPVFIDGSNKYQFFLTVYGNKVKEDQLQFRIVTSSTNELAVPVTFSFESDKITGSIKTPFKLSGHPLLVKDGKILPDHFDLSQNYPNPFNPTTRIDFAIPKDGDVKVIIYNIMGEKVRTLVNESKHAGYYSTIWDGRNDHNATVSSGIYLYRMLSGSYSSTKKLMLL